MLTHPVACKLWTALAAAPKEWFATPEAQQLIEKTHQRIREVAGDDEANIFLTLVMLAGIMPG